MKKNAKIAMTKSDWGSDGYPKDVKGTCSVCGHEVYASAWNAEEEAKMNAGSFTKAYCRYCNDQAIIVKAREGARLG